MEGSPSDPSGVGPVINPSEWTDCHASKERTLPLSCVWCFGVFLIFILICATTAALKLSRL